MVVTVVLRNTGAGAGAFSQMLLSRPAIRLLGETLVRRSSTRGQRAAIGTGLLQSVAGVSIRHAGRHAGSRSSARASSGLVLLGRARQTFPVPDYRGAGLSGRDLDNSVPRRVGARTVGLGLDPQATAPRRIAFRWSGVVPPQHPMSSESARATSRHSSRTQQPVHRALARSP